MTAFAELAADPHSAYLRLRAQDPVSWLPEAGQWLVTRWHDVLRVLSDPERFANGHADIHDAFHEAYEPGLSPADIDTITRPIARKAADDLFAAGEADLTAEYFERVAAVAGATMLGLGLGCVDTLLRWGKTLARDPDADTTEDAAVIVGRLRRLPEDSLAARLVRVDADPVPLLKHLAVSVLKPGWLAAWTLAALWSDPAQFTAVWANRHLLGAAVYEALRWGGPVGVLTRRTTCPVSLGGREIPAGESLAVAVASANRDETAFLLPQRFDVHRKVRPHLGFGVGPRPCPAYPMVIALARTALDELFERMPNLCPAPGWRRVPEGWRLRLPGPVDAVWNS
ncbi:cytochrome P450 [Actinophytocola sp.]|uniref:cytochrome P450 n=1 Tax=Actinophytocola sp. TaxID=1872138 RepID=UPI00389B0E35